MFGCGRREAAEVRGGQNPLGRRPPLVMAVVVVMLVGGSLAIDPDLIYDTYADKAIQFVNQTFIRNISCDCRMWCFTEPTCTAVTITTLASGQIQCSLSSHSQPTTLFVADQQSTTLVKAVPDTPACQPEGQIYHNTTNCKITQCRNGQLVTYTDSTAANMTLSDLASSGCLELLETPMTWSEARTKCQETGGDLYVAGDFQGLREFVETSGYTNVWVGSKSQKWLDGRAVTTEEWFREDPNGAPDDCVRLSKQGGAYWMADRGCDVEYQALCQRAVTYP